jgi:hypothetical protein
MECCSVGVLRPVRIALRDRGLGCCKGGTCLERTVSFFIFVDLRKTDLPPLWGGYVF